VHNPTSTDCFGARSAQRRPAIQTRLIRRQRLLAAIVFAESISDTAHYIRRQLSPPSDWLNSRRWHG